jgi:predicted NUDIX family phosphoesterase
MKEEMILVVRRETIEKLGMWQGLNFEVDRYLPVLLARENNFFMARSAAETDAAFKQIIPYVLLVHGGKVLHYVRGKKSGEQRLVSKGSIGIGGHMNEQDEGLFALDEAAYLEGVRREVCEELKIGTKFRNRVVALLNDDSNEVGRVHMGVVHVFDLEEPTVEKNEAMITNLAFLSPEELEERREMLESWSQICLDGLGELLGDDVSVVMERLRCPGKTFSAEEVKRELGL